MRVLPDEVEEVAWVVRRAFARYAREEGSSATLAGRCLEASMTLKLLLCKRGYKAAIVLCRGHAWVEVDGFIVDVTATQFGIHEKVLIRPVGVARKKGVYSAGAEKRLKWWNGEKGYGQFWIQMVRTVVGDIDTPSYRPVIYALKALKMSKQKGAAGGDRQQRETGRSANLHQQDRVRRRPRVVRQLRASRRARAG